MLSKRVFLTLFAATVAVGLSGRSYGLAPVIKDPGDIYIGDAEGVGADNFNYPDTFDLLRIGSDDSFTSPVNIKWSYYANPGTITINGIQPLSSNNLALAVNPPEGATSPSQFRIDLHDYDLGNPGQDASPYTVTFRNAALSPIGGPNTDPGVNGVVTSQTQTITLFASDCTTASFRSIVVYTANQTSDSVSGGQALETIRDNTFPADLRPGWLGGVIAGGGSTSTASGMCMFAPLLGVGGANVIGWSYIADLSEPGFIELVDNAVWRVRTFVSTPDNPPVNTAPLFDFTYKNEYFAHDANYNVIAPFLLNPLTYGGETVTRDTQGGANAPRVIGPGVGRNSFDFWCSPASMLLPQWRGLVDAGDSAFDTDEDPRNDLNISYRLLDVDGATLGETQTGTICVTQITVDRASLLDIWSPNDTPAYGPNLRFFPPDGSSTNPASPAFYAGPGTTVFAATTDPEQDLNESNSTGNVNNTTGIAQYKLAGGGGVGSRKTMIAWDASAPDFNSALYPIVWESDKLYLIEMDAKADDAPAVGDGPAADTNPPLFYEVIGFEPTIENLTVHVVLRGYEDNINGNKMLRAGTPRLPSNVGNAVQRYVGLYYTHNKTVVQTTDHPDRVGPRVGFFNPGALDGTGLEGLDPMAITGFKMFDLTPAIQ
jgi:hypothetical protein